MTEPNYLSLSNYANRKDMPLLTRQEIQEFVEYNPETGIFIECNKERHFLGYFPTKEEAKSAYDQAARALHKEFASVG